MDTALLRTCVLSLRNLPAIPVCARAILLCPADESHLLAEWVQRTAIEPSLAQALLEQAADLHGGMPANLEEAVRMLGVLPARAAVFRWFMQTRLLGNAGHGIDRTAFWKEALHCAALADRIAQQTQSPWRGEAYVAGLLHNVGKLVLDTVAPEGYTRALDLTRAQGLFELDAERRELGADHTLAGKWLAEAWQLPFAYVAPIWLHHQPPESLDAAVCPAQLIQMVSLAGLLAHQQLAAGPGEAVLSSTVIDRARALGLTQDAVLQLLQERIVEDEAEAMPRRAEAPAVAADAAVRSRLRRAEATTRFYRDLSDAASLSTLWTRFSQGVRDLFAVPAGMGFSVDADTQCVEGAYWHPLEPHSQPIFALLAAGATEDPLADLLRYASGEFSTLLNAWRRQRLLAIPVAHEGRVLGQLLCEPGSVDAVDFSALTELTSGLGGLLARCQERQRAEMRAESLATALWERELAYRQAVRGERLDVVAKLAAGAAHEINNPLTAIVGRAQLLLSRGLSPEDNRAIETIAQQGRRISKILSDLMQFARPPAPHWETTLITFVLHQVVGMMRDRLAAKQIRVVEDYAPSLPRVSLDRRQIEQVILNLLLNAEQGMQDRGGVLTLRAKPGHDRRSIIVQVADTGQGIAPEIMDQVFEPFFTTRSETENSGLGLAVCHGIIEAHRGAITLHSVAGEGATCTITLPAAAEADIETPVPAPRPHALRQLVLVAEADESLREVLRESLVNRGYAVQLASDPLETQAALIAYPIDTVFFDLGIGFDAFRQIRERHAAVPVIVSGGIADAELFEEARHWGASAALPKPFEIEQFFAEIQRAFASRHVA
jgi:signal transduction histidine kinase/HD-like signal output (HDOD) protein/CheY-like chemotaxis protein